MPVQSNVGYSNLQSEPKPTGSKHVSSKVYFNKILQQWECLDRICIYICSSDVSKPGIWEYVLQSFDDIEQRSRGP